MIKKNYLLLLFLVIDLCAFSSFGAGDYIQQSTPALKNNSSANFAPMKVDPSNITITKPEPNPTTPTLQKIQKPTATKPPIKLQNNIPSVAQKPLANKSNNSAYDKMLEEKKLAESIQKKDMEAQNSAMIKDLNRRDIDSALVKQLSSLNYKVQTPPKKLYNRNYSSINRHLPPVYFKSYYLYMAFKAAERDDHNGLNAILLHYNFLNGQNQDGDTVLMHAIRSNSLSASRLLLAKGAYVDAINKRKRTALHYAATLGNLDLIKLLLSVGSDYTITDDNNMTAIEYAYATKQDEAAKMIEQYIEQNKN